MEIAKKKYSKRVKKYKKKYKLSKTKEGFTSWFRLFVFISGIIGVIFLHKVSIVLTLAILSIFFIIFIFLFKLSARLCFRMNLFEQLEKINSNELIGLSGDSSPFDDGKEFVDREHPYTFDLDIFGPDSVFQFFNRTVTRKGKTRLADMLESRLQTSKEIVRRQEAIVELRDKLDWRQKFQAYGQLFPEEKDDLPSINNWMQSDIYFSKKVVYKFVLLASTIFTIVTLVLSILSLVSFQIFVFSIFFELLLLSIYLGKINKVHNEVTQYHKLLKKFQYLLSLIEEEIYSSKLLKDLQQDLFYEDKSACERITRLAKTIDSLDNRLNVIAGILLNLFLLWDLRHMIKLEKWRMSCRKNIDKWFAVIAEVDALSSLAGFSFNHPYFIFPTISANKKILEAKQTGHPLLADEVRIDNNFTVGKQGDFVIITGPNMAGKSTFLRTIGVNMVLAYAGAPVCASEFSCTLMDVYSSMRTSDSIQKGESYFYAELKRLREIIEKLKRKESSFIILDEILKGTNSKDKASGSKAFLGKLIQLEGSGIVATHDLSLCDIENELPQNIENQCFEVEIENSNIHFDYLLREGITSKMNATFLMEQMGIIT